mmetsp:Transcript_29804/g.96146  ORF Transcript_29804/g.96146 Transcript_29804/m.96146 type:complete len:354 (+) Transcript_29804:82-1143(+)
MKKSKTMKSSVVLFCVLCLFESAVQPALGGAVTLYNHCAVQATVDWEEVYTKVPSGKTTVAAFYEAELVPDCVTGIKVEASVRFEDDIECTAHAYPVACGYRPFAYEDNNEYPPISLQLECADYPSGQSAKSKAPWLCSLTEVHEICQVVDGDADLRAFCPPRSTPMSELDEGDFSACLPARKAGFPLVEKTRCPLCLCVDGTSCHPGPHCGDCQNAVTRSAVSSCRPHNWTTAQPSRAPTKGPEKKEDVPEPSPAPATPAAADKKQARRASNVAAFVIALLAVGIAACAVRQAVVKQRRFNAPRSGLYVDIPSMPGSGFSRHRGERTVSSSAPRNNASSRGGSSAIEMISGL